MAKLRCDICKNPMDLKRGAAMASPSDARLACTKCYDNLSARLSAGEPMSMKKLDAESSDRQMDLFGGS